MEKTLWGEETLKPSGIPSNKLKKQILNLDEFEEIRLCNHEGLSQIEAGDVLGVEVQFRGF